MDYLVFGKNIYLKNCNDIFNYYNYEDEKIGYFNIYIAKKEISFSYSKKNIEAINLFSEVLYFMGNKKKNIVCLNNDDLNSIGFIKKEKNIKYIKEFERERNKKYKTIDELYNNPHLVPWNLVERENDVMFLVNKYVTKNNKILEIGSGYGKNLCLLKENGYNNVVGIEYSKNAYELSRKKISNNILGDITNTKFDNNSFDAIIDIGCLHCVCTENRKKAFNEILRILKKDGFIISRYFLKKDTDWIKKYPVKISEFGNNYHEILDMFDNFIILETFEENECVYVVGRKK